MIHGMVDRPLIFTVDELKRLPSVYSHAFPRVHRKSCEAPRIKQCRRRTG